ncbi:hypothetical protein FisN_5Lh345 [Fistulifera solaris]|uniref:peptidylprolyl isomerase n=1 Tax=Fistulifera solaris TaxID=1519565 RepID=A0A1Z5KG44_FISSO|nr:hypothetical protein FisN_5Lh345 [Fistulifera solaris]|eukprot:GAX25263.1 hypothetical protein FisN_5Lh345 [Fistulifera solaris]
MMNNKLNGKHVDRASPELNTGVPTTSVNSSRKTPVSEHDTRTSPRSAESSPTRGSLEWLKAKRDWWKESQQSKLVEYPASEWSEILKAQKALDLLCAIQEGKADASGITQAINSSGKDQGNQINSFPETTTRDNQFRNRLVAFYEKYNPSKLSAVDETLQKYRGKEDEMFMKLEAKYAKDPYLPAIGTGPQCFMEFSTGGRVTFELFQDKVPFAAENFRSLCTGETGASYRNCVVHRIVPNFCIQAGDYTKGDGTGGRSIYPKAALAYPKTDMWGNFEDETPFLRHDAPGLLSMANNGPNRNSSQFFITLRPLPHLNGKHVVFGRVTHGMDVVETLSRLETNSKTQRPIELLRITKCGEIRAEATVSPKQGIEKPSNDTVPTSVSTACDIDAPPFSLSRPNSNGSFVKSVLPFDSATSFKSNQEDMSIMGSTASTKFEQRQKDDLVSSNSDLNLCMQISSCLHQLEHTDNGGNNILRKSGESCLQSSVDLPRKDHKEKIIQGFSVNSFIDELLLKHRARRTIATFLVEDPLGLSFMMNAKGKEKALLQTIPQLHDGAITLRSVLSVRRRSTKAEKPIAGVLDCSHSTNTYQLKCDPLFVALSIHTLYD